MLISINDLAKLIDETPMQTMLALLAANPRMDTRKHTYTVAGEKMLLLDYELAVSTVDYFPAAPMSTKLQNAKAQLKKWIKKYPINFDLNSKTFPIFGHFSRPGQQFVHSDHLHRFGQITMPPSQWLYHKRKKIPLEPNIDFLRIRRGYREAKTAYLFTIPAAVKLLKGIKYGGKIIQYLETVENPIRVNNDGSL